MTTFASLNSSNNSGLEFLGLSVRVILLPFTIADMAFYILTTVSMAGLWTVASILKILAFYE